MDEARLKRGLNQTQYGVALMLLGPYLLWLIPSDFPKSLSLVGALLPVLTVLGLSNWRKAAPDVAPAASKIAWVSIVLATALQAGVCLGVIVLNVDDYWALGQFYTIAVAFQIVCLLFLLVVATSLARSLAAPVLTRRFQLLSGAVPVVAVAACYLFLLAPHFLAVSLTLAMTLGFVLALVAALGQLAARVIVNAPALRLDS
jgi:hypothetical protein